MLSAIFKPPSDRGGVFAGPMNAPTLVIKIEDVGSEIFIEQVRPGRCALGVSTLSGEDTNIDSQTALRDQLMIFVSPLHDFAGFDHVIWSQLDDQPLIPHRKKSNIRLLTEMGFEQAGLSLRAG
ncbi:MULTISPECIES: LysR substrate-binding domain-containing protein [Ochrobactrum]|uniref:LysR substrate-binding domain-containing protein n=1 Tax=Ochrobactrum TaxID=528 RepID=UPI001F1EF3A3|nr:MULTISPECIES: LysR substrate-binding domain-containing protein [Brucella/Ochrobactrum group]MDH7792570.1 DNA-binding transcriptional LysR family regulator [Ochrobactrum sp. AN78]